MQPLRARNGYGCSPYGTRFEPQLNTYSWGELPWQIAYAQKKGVNVYLTVTWPPNWANGAVSQNAPWSGNCGDCGRTVLNSNNTWNFFYTLGIQFNGSNNYTAAACQSGTYNASGCHPLVQYVGLLRETNSINDYNDTYFDSNSGNFLNDFCNQYLFPAHDGLKSANPSAYLVAPEVSASAPSSCGGFNISCNWLNSWLKPMMQYFYASFDVISIHYYSTSNEVPVRNAVDSVYNAFGSAKPIWVTESAFTNQSLQSVASDVTAVYIAEHNRYYWTKLFYRLGQYEDSCASGSGLVCGNGGTTLSLEPAFTAYQQVYPR